MEQKSFKLRKSSLIFNRLSDKRNWFILSVIIMMITIVIIPVSLNIDINEGNIVFGMFEIFLLVFINCLIDFSYLHDDRRFAYYASKPITGIKSINIWIAVNVIYAAVLVAMLGGIALITGSLDHVNKIFVAAVPWLIAGIFTAALSSVISGNTVAAGISTIINFTLPLSVLGIIAYAFRITEDFALGFKMEILFQKFIENIYRIDILYFYKYAEDGIDFTFFIVLAGILAFIYSITLWLNKKRKNEKIGDMIVFEGYKKLISVILSSVAPFVFSAIFAYNSVQGKIISFVILSALTYYIMNAVLEKSFILRRSTVKFYGAFLLSFIVFICVINFSTNRFENYVPDEKEISSIYFGSDYYMYSEKYEESKSLYSANEDYMKTVKDVILYKDEDSIQQFINLHKSILKNQNYSYNESFAIVYYLKNGKTVARHYMLKGAQDYLEEKNQIVRSIVTGNEYKLKKYPFFYDAEYIEDMNMTSMDYYVEKMSDSKPETMNEFIDVNNKYNLIENIRKDHESYINSKENNLIMVMNERKGFYNYNQIPERYGDYVENEVSSNNNNYYLNISYQINDVPEQININFNENFENTITYLSGK